MANRFHDVLARFDAGGVIQPGDREAIREALEHQIARVVFVQLDWGEWSIGSRRYPDWIGYTHIHKLLTHPGEQIHVYDMTHLPDLENSRKAVQKAVSRVVGALVSTQPTIGLHLQSDIKTGEYCTYNGDWDWRVSQ